VLETSYRHINWARQNEEFAKSLDPKFNIDANWAITAVFYAAVHYVDAYFAARGQRPVDHDEREQKLNRDDFFASVRKIYKELKRLSREARYEMAPYGEKEVRQSQALLEHIRSLVLTKFSNTR
jgi:hypothetical protein